MKSTRCAAPVWVWPGRQGSTEWNESHTTNKKKQKPRQEDKLKNKRQKKGPFQPRLLFSFLFFPYAGHTQGGEAREGKKKEKRSGKGCMHDPHAKCLADPGRYHSKGVFLANKTDNKIIKSEYYGALARGVEIKTARHAQKKKEGHKREKKESKKETKV